MNFTDLTPHYGASFLPVDSPIPGSTQFRCCRITAGKLWVDFLKWGRVEGRRLGPQPLVKSQFRTPNRKITFCQLFHRILRFKVKTYGKGNLVCKFFILFICCRFLVSTSITFSIFRLHSQVPDLPWKFIYISE